MTSPRLRILDQADKLRNVAYDIRGEVSAEAERMEMDGNRILRLDTGNRALFGFHAPDVIMRDMIAALPTAHGYSSSKGTVAGRRVFYTRYELEDYHACVI